VSSGIGRAYQAEQAPKSRGGSSGVLGKLMTWLAIFVIVILLWNFFWRTASWPVSMHGAPPGPWTCVAVSP